MPTVYRIIKSKYLKKALTGEGARLYGGRWNPAGVPVIYTAQSVALAALEILVHLPRGAPLTGYRLLEIQWEEISISIITKQQLPRNWRAPRYQSLLYQLSSQWIQESRSLVLQVPSAVIDDQVNYLINPLHADFSKLLVSPARRFWLDPRLVK